ncbi:DUF4192 domain-containing protein [Nocardia pseudovaccinii]|uniref:DUF4192 domain-containing protein n=1 Tax=Nocardia pseudovaccinii TaxID=189540 RepID=UPI0007A42A37|nr:DUF4192 domain-containing protein [Nocardia pseudovaccinii]
MSDNTDDDAPSQPVDAGVPDPGERAEQAFSADSLHVDDPGELIVAVPAMVGFVPERSLLIAVLRNGPDPNGAPVIDAVARFDLYVDRDGDERPGSAAAYAEAVARICATEGSCEVLAVIVDDRALPLRPDPDRHHEGAGGYAGLIEALAHLLADQQVLLAGAWVVRSIEANEPWWSLLDTEHVGTLPDPAASMVAAAHVFHGRPIRATRSQLTDLLTPDSELTVRVAAHLEQSIAAAHDRYAAAVRAGDPDAYHRQTLERVLRQIADTDSGTNPTAREYADLAVALRDRVVRDALFGLADGEHADAAERLWLALSHATTGTDRADAATLLGFSAYIRGDGVLAGIAIQAAHDADPTHSMAILLATCLTTGMRPETVRRLAHCGHTIAADLGIDLGPGTR